MPQKSVREDLGVLMVAEVDLTMVGELEVTDPAVTEVVVTMVPTTVTLQVVATMEEWGMVVVKVATMVEVSDKVVLGVDMVVGIVEITMPLNLVGSSGTLHNGGEEQLSADQGTESVNDFTPGAEGSYRDDNDEPNDCQLQGLIICASMPFKNFGFGKYMYLRHRKCVLFPAGLLLIVCFTKFYACVGLNG